MIGLRRTLTSDADAMHPSNIKQRREYVPYIDNIIHTRVNVASHWGHWLKDKKLLSRRIQISNPTGTYNPGAVWVFVVRWCRFRSASRANTLLHPAILQGHELESDVFFFVIEVNFFLTASLPPCGFETESATGGWTPPVRNLDNQDSPFFVYVLWPSKHPDALSQLQCN